MIRTVTLLMFLLVGIVAVIGRPQSAPGLDTVVPTSTAATTTTTTNVEGSSQPIPTSTEESKVSKFFDDVSSVFKQGTARVKESFESAASSVKDGVMRGYDYVKDKLTGSVQTPATNATDTVPTTSAVTAVETSTVAVRASSKATVSSIAKAINVEPNDEEMKDENEDRLIFIGDEETGTDPPTTTIKKGLEDRFIIDGPTACKTGQSVVNGKCRNTF
ncbi:uncharacterized protein LOC128745736 [Sabethes cyaneus]|uniref:uncharacterized protein LOC128745736 n=1 Tax=Sabethes cyaneus TaxID=53552 RepID=UPI00237DF76A|nr:uncharacterized protein LOC128745736 [Sabethes cyaneus]